MGVRGRAIVVLLMIAAAWVAASPALAAAPAAPATPTAATAPKIPLAVIPFVGPDAGVPEGFGEALGEAIRYGLRQVRAVRLVESDDILGAGQRLNVSFADVLSDEAALKLAGDLQTRGLVAGT